MLSVMQLKKILSTLMLVSLVVAKCPLVEAADKTIHFQGKLKDAQGNLLSGPQNIRFQLWSHASSTESRYYVKDLGFYGVDCANGLFNIELGKSGDGQSGALNNLPFDEQYWIEVSFGDNNVLSPRQPIGSAGYAHGSMGDFNVGGILRTGNVYLNGSGDRYALYRQGDTVGSKTYLFGGDYADMVFLQYSGKFTFQTYDTSWRDRLTIDHNGNVGIGTTNSGAKLEIKGTFNYSNGLKVESNSTLGTGILLNNTDTGGRRFGIFATGSANGEGVGKLAFLDDAVGTRMVIDSNGNVGIGTTEPNAKFKIYGSPSDSQPSASDSYKGIFSIGATTYGGLAFGSYLSSPYGSWIQSMDQRTGGGGYYPLILNPVAGNVGIGTPNPQAKLEVNGNLKASSYSGLMLGTAVEKSVGTQETAPCDGFVQCLMFANSSSPCYAWTIGYIGSTARASCVVQDRTPGGQPVKAKTGSFLMPVKSGETWKVTLTEESASDNDPSVSVWWIPLGQ